jgi:hypothetical protein
MAAMRDDTARVREQIEIERLRNELAGEFDDVSPDVIEQGIRNEFQRRAAYPVQDFVPVFVERSIRQKLSH